MRITAVLLLSLAARVASAQTASSVEIAAGVAATTGFAGKNAGVGPLLRIGIRTDRAESVLNYRFDVEGLRLGAAPSPSQGSQTRRSVIAVGAVFSGIIPSIRNATAPYAIVGMALQAIRDSNIDAYPGSLLGLRGGFGVRTKLHDVNLSLESSIQFAVAGVPGGINTARVGSFVPIALGIRF